MSQKYYKVIVHRAHQGGKRAASLTLYLIAENALYACEAAKKFPGVKHSKAALSCCPITLEEYEEGRQISAYQRMY
jgi:hypothetical protein